MGILKMNGIYFAEMGKLNAQTADLFAKIIGIAITRNYASVYPPAHSDTYVKATSKWDTNYWPYFATDPAKSLTGLMAGKAWGSAYDVITNQRFHIDLGSAQIIKRIYYENAHTEGFYSNYGVKNFTFWGSNTGVGSFDDLVFANDEGWMQLTCSQGIFDQHSAVDAADPKYILVTNNTAYRYYAFKFVDNWGYTHTMQVRRIELQTIRYVSVYPPAHSDTYVKATSKQSTSFWPYFSTDPTQPLTGTWTDNAWLSYDTASQRFHIDLGSANIIKRIYYENEHLSGILTNAGCKNFTLWGSNTGAGSFDDLVYANDEGWTQLTCAQSSFDQHSAADAADPKYILVMNNAAYRYYAFKFADNWGNASYSGVRRIELQVIG